MILTIPLPANRTMSLFRMLPFLFCAAWPGAPSMAASSQDLQHLRQQGQTWLQAQTLNTWPDIRSRVSIGPVDNRLRLPACLDVRFSLPANAQIGNRGSLRAECLAPARWSLYISFQVGLSGPALVSRRDLPPRSRISATDLALQDIDYAHPPSAYLRDTRLAIGALTNQRIPAGQPVLSSALVSPPVINAGQRVRLVVEGVGFAISHEGHALNSAAAGAPVRVKIRNGRIVQGIAQADGNVQVRP